MQTIDTIRTIKAGRFTVRVTAEEEHDIDLFFDEDGSVSRAIDNGELMVFCAKAACYLDGLELATDYLGNCIYASPREFMDHLGIRAHNAKLSAEAGRRVVCGSYFTDMIHTVIREARQAVRDLQCVRVRQTA